MPRKKTLPTKDKDKDKEKEKNQPHTPEMEARKKLWREIFGVGLGLSGIFLIICLIIPDSTGEIGSFLNIHFMNLFGLTSYLFPFVLVYLGYSVAFKGNPLAWYLTLPLIMVLYCDLTVFVEVISQKGGLVGGVIGDPVLKSIGKAGGIISTIGISLILIIVITGISLKDFLRFVQKGVLLIYWLLTAFYRFLTFQSGEPEKEEQLLDAELEEIPSFVPQSAETEEEEEEEPAKPTGKPMQGVLFEDEDEDEELEGIQFITIDNSKIRTGVLAQDDGEEPAPQKIKTRTITYPKTPVAGYKYKLPPLDLLESAEKVQKQEAPRDLSPLLEETLKSFGVDVKVVDIIRGPTVTRYELQPAKGVKVKKVTNLSNDIALALAAYSIRIEAPIPGKSAIGIEVPNDIVEPVFLKDILVSAKYKKQSVLSLALGRDITGKAIMENLLKMPHLLIAGATGSGKSVCLNGVIASILYKATPLDVQMVMIDPKRVELSLFEGIPHLVDVKTPSGKKIVTDPKTATQVLKTVSEIMDQRYEDFVALKVRNIAEFNEKAEIPIPYIVVVIDELADLMMVSSATVEQYICRIAQLGRASGIHLIVATQRPSVDVITGLIKANIPSRIAFAVSSQVDSRTILDRAGAEKLLGKGDMLYAPVDASDFRRIQGAYVSGDEIMRVVDFWCQQPPPENIIPIEIHEEKDKDKKDDDDQDAEDPLLDEAIEVIKSTKQASASNLQRKMKIGYARAGRIMDQLEKKGIVGPADGSKPRKIFLPGFDIS